jgi:hypothetical protein
LKNAYKEDFMKKAEIFKTFLVFFMMLTLSLAGLSKEKTVASNWTSSPINIDGSAVEWKDDALSTEKKGSVEYGFRNDADYLFVLFIFKDPKYLSTIDATGMTLWFNTEGKKKEKYGITFIKQRVSAEAFISVLEQQKGALSEEEKNNIRINPYYFLHNAKVINKESQSASQSAGGREAELAVFRSMRQQKVVFYEFAVPLKRLTPDAHGIGTEPGKTIKIGFEWGGMTREMIEAIAKRSADAATRPERADRSGGSWEKGETGSSAMPRVGSRAKKHSFWVDVQLAKIQ